MPHVALRFSAHFIQTTARGLKLKPEDEKLWHDTEFFSPGSFYRHLGDLREDMPAGTSIFSNACSTGEEPLSVAMMLVDRFGPEKAKETTIHAMDIGEQAVRQAQSDTVYVNHQERLNSRDCLSGDIADFLDPIEQQEDASRPILQSNKPAQPHRLKPWFRDILRSGLLQVKRGDVRTDLAPPSDQPAIVLFRNAWHYLKDKERTDLIGKLFQTLKSGSVIGVGHLEQQRSGEYATKTRQSTVELLERGGFKPMTKKNPVFFVKP